MAQTRVLPHNLEAEQSVLGCILIDNELQSELITDLSDGDFYVEAHKDIFKSMCDIYNQSKPIDLVTLSDRLDSEGKLDIVGGIRLSVDNSVDSKLSLLCGDSKKRWNSS